MLWPRGLETNRYTHEPSSLAHLSSVTVDHKGIWRTLHCPTYSTGVCRSLPESARLRQTQIPDSGSVTWANFAGLSPAESAGVSGVCQDSVLQTPQTLAGIIFILLINKKISYTNLINEW